MYSPKAIASEEVRSLEARLEEIDRGGLSLAALVRGLQADLARLAAEIAGARKELRGETRRRRAAVERVVERIVVHHVHEPRCPGSKQVYARLDRVESKQVYARLDRVEIVPRQGEARSYDAREAAAGHATERGRSRASGCPSGPGRARAGGCGCRGRGGRGSRRPGSSGPAAGSRAR